MIDGEGVSLVSHERKPKTLSKIKIHKIRMQRVKWDNNDYDVFDHDEKNQLLLLN